MTLARIIALLFVLVFVLVFCIGIVALNIVEAGGFQTVFNWLWCGKEICK